MPTKTTTTKNPTGKRAPDPPLPFRLDRSRRIAHPVDHAFAVMNQRAYDVFREQLVAWLRDDCRQIPVRGRRRAALVAWALAAPAAELSADKLARRFMARLLRGARGRRPPTSLTPLPEKRDA